MTSPISLFTIVGAAEPAAPAPVPEDPGLFNAVLSAALQAGMLPAAPPVSAAPCAPDAPLGAGAEGEDPPVEGDAAGPEAPVAHVDGEGPSAPRAAGVPEQEPVAMRTDDDSEAAGTDGPAADAGQRAPGRPLHRAPARAGDPSRSPEVAHPSEGELSPRRPPASASNPKRAPCPIGSEATPPSPRMPVVVARAWRAGAPAVQATARISGDGPRVTADVVSAEPTAAAPAVEPSPGSAAPGPIVSLAERERPAVAVPVKSPAPESSGERSPRLRTGLRTEPAEPGAGIVTAPATPTLTLPVSSVEPATPAPAPLAVAWHTARRSDAMPAPVSSKAHDGEPATVTRPEAESDEPALESLGTPRDMPAPMAPATPDPMPAPRLPVAPPVPLPRAAERLPVAMDDEAEALISRARRNLQATGGAAAALPLARMVAPRGRPAGPTTPLPMADGGLTRAVPAVPAVEALMQALSRTLEGAEIAAVRVTMGSGQPVRTAPTPPEDAADGTGTGRFPVPSGDKPSDGMAGPRGARPGTPAERPTPVDRGDASAPLAGTGRDDDVVPSAVDRPAVERMPARPGRAELTGFEPTGRALREAIAARPAMVPAPDLPSDRQELPVAPHGEPGRTARQDREERPDEPAPSDVAARGSAGAPDGRAREARAPAGADRGAAREAHELREAWVERGRPAGAADRVTLQVADVDGRQTRIRVSVLGDQVRATILPPDTTSARQLEQRMDELQATLVRQGFTDAKVTVQAGRGEGALPWSAGQAIAPNELRSSSGTDQPPGDQRQGTGRRDGDRQGDGQRHPHQRPRERDPNDRRRH